VQLPISHSLCGGGMPAEFTTKGIRVGIGGGGSSSSGGGGGVRRAAAAGAAALLSLGDSDQAPGRARDPSRDMGRIRMASPQGM
jgi:hypothetical protein